MCSEEPQSREEVLNILQIMQRQETTTYRRFDYLSGCSTSGSAVVDGPWRQRIVEWMFGVVDHCSLRRDSVAVATYYLDLSVQKKLISSRQEFQLAAMTALQLAIKLYDSTMVKLDSMVKLGRGLFVEKDVVEMERRMLDALRWQVHPPTPICFLRQYLRLLPDHVSPMTKYLVAEVTRFISEISICLYKFVDCLPSVVAYAGMLIAMERIDNVALPVWQRKEIFTTMKTAMGLDNESETVLNAVYMLQTSLEKNVSLEDLLQTIGAQCLESYGKVPANTYSIHSSNSVSSPRDVRRQ